MTQQKQGNSLDLKLWLLIGACALILVGIGILVAVITGAGATSIFSEFLEANWAYLTVAIVVIVAGVIGLVFYRKKQTLTRSQWTVKELVVGALCIGLAFVLSYIRIWHMPMGGSITPASMLPIFLFAYIYGTPKGLIVAVAYGLLQMLQDAYLVHWAQVMLDYILGFGVLALAGLFRKNIIPGVVVGGLARLVCSFLSGVIFFAEYAPEGMSPVVYSLGYQATYMIPEIIICILITLIPGVRKNIELLKKQATSQKKTPAVS